MTTWPVLARAVPRSRRRFPWRQGSCAPSPALPGFPARVSPQDSGGLEKASSTRRASRTFACAGGANPSSSILCCMRLAGSSANSGTCTSRYAATRDDGFCSSTVGSTGDFDLDRPRILFLEQLDFFCSFGFDPLLADLRVQKQDKIASFSDRTLSYHSKTTL